jgi:hypothetical protein
MVRKEQDKKLPDLQAEKQKQEVHPQQLHLFSAFRDVWQSPAP